MRMTQQFLEEIDRLLSPIRHRIANSIARAVIENVDDSLDVQMMQLGVDESESVEDCERFQDYGFTSKPLNGAEAVVIFPNGDRNHPLVVATADRSFRIKDLGGGEVAIYNKFGAIVKLKADGTIEAGSDGGTFGPLATKADLDAHKSWAAGHTHAFAAGPGTTNTPLPLPPNPIGTTKLKAE